MIIDDHAILRSGIRMLIEAQSDIRVVAEAANGQEALDKLLLEAEQIDILLLDISMPGTSGIELIEHIKKTYPALKILVLTMHDDEGYLHRALSAGTNGYLLKKAADIELITAIRAVANGEVYIHPAMTAYLLKNYKNQHKMDDNARALLTEREKEVLRLVARGYTNKQIADELFISIKTVEVYKAKIKEKLNARGRSDLVKVAIEQGLL